MALKRWMICIKAKQLFGAVHPRWCLDADDASRIRPKEANKLRKENEMKESEKKDIELILEKLEKFSSKDKKLVLDFCQHIILIDGLRNEAN